MKYLPAALALACASAGAAPRKPPRQPPADLRQSVELFQRYHGSLPLPPRQLTPGERAELRRQLSESSKPALGRR